jgi:glutathione S-transferase
MPMYKLYGITHTSTCAAKAALCESGALFEEVEIATRKGQHLTEEYRQINPRQQVPPLMLPDGTIMTEGPAIMLHVADAHPKAKLAPPPGTSERAQHDRWLIFLAMNVNEAGQRMNYPERFTTDTNGKEGVEEAARAYMDRHFRLFEAAMGDGPYFFGDAFTMLDIYVWMLSHWPGGSRDLFEADCPKIIRLANTAKLRPKIVPIEEENFGT